MDKSFRPRSVRTAIHFSKLPTAEPVALRSQWSFRPHKGLTNQSNPCFPASFFLISSAGQVELS